MPVIVCGVSVAAGVKVQDTWRSGLLMSTCCMVTKGFNTNVFSRKHKTRFPSWTQKETGQCNDLFFKSGQWKDRVLGVGRNFERCSAGDRHNYVRGRVGAFGNCL